MKKEKQYLKNNQKKIMVSDHDLNVVGGDEAMNKIFREARDNAVKKLCGCEFCQTTGSKC